METLHIIKLYQSGAFSKMVIRLNGDIKKYPKTLIIFDKVFKRRGWSVKTNEIYYDNEE